MILEYIRYRIDPDRVDAFDEAYKRAGEFLDASPHCRCWEVARSVDAPERQIVRIEWDSTEGHLEGFRKSDAFGPFVEATRPFFEDIEEMTHYELRLGAEQCSPRLVRAAA